jgi:hypothetical protein
MLPTGHESLTNAEAEVTGAIAADVLPFRISNWGTGGGIGLSTGFAAPIGSFAAGLSVGYVVAREFDLREGEEFAYRPGNQLHVRAAIDRTFGQSGKAALQVTVQRFDEDQVNGANLYQSGNRYKGVASYSFAAGARSSGVVYTGYLRREEGEFEGQAQLMPAEDLLFLGGGLRMPVGRSVVQPTADLRILGRQDGTGQGWTSGIGGTVEIPAGALTFVPTARARFGNVTLRENAESTFTGAEIGMSIQFGASGR